MSLIDMSQFDRMMLDPVSADHTGGRDAPSEELAALGAPPPDTVEEHPIPADPHRESCLEQWGLRA